MFWMGPYIARLLSPSGMLTTAALCAAVRWLLFSFELDIAFLVLLQMSSGIDLQHGVSRPNAHHRRLCRPSQILSVQGLYVTIQAVCSAGATLAAGAIFKTHSAWVFVLSAGLALLPARRHRQISATR